MKESDVLYSKEKLGKCFAFQSFEKIRNWNFKTLRISGIFKKLEKRANWKKRAPMKRKVKFDQIFVCSFLDELKKYP